ncbi:hypothetical protein A3Q56_01254 [Intoshia linei]|uniref:valine--tRNA ligase n=1 Tax=Intoshia linei TaxID=1819745 RepID=A0A177B9P1_9BILA|nr:hypothetical protein A3Q56_01254 [Intoshia linei]
MELRKSLVKFSLQLDESTDVFARYVVNDNIKEEYEVDSLLFLPPPNITGNLHLGHAFGGTLQDVYCRWLNYKNLTTKWIPGTDHAGIATYTKVLAYMKENELPEKNRKIIFEKWNKEKQLKICQQIKKMGFGVDWDFYYNTIDSVHCESVIDSFIQLFDKGKIKRKMSCVNWCCFLKTSIADFEVQKKSIKPGNKIKFPSYFKPVNCGRMFEIKYEIDQMPGQYITIGTTRPETLLADVAICVNPDDIRYLKFNKKFAIHPILKTKLPIIADTMVYKDFGTGAMKITPLHDNKDFTIAKSHNLGLGNCTIDKSGNMINVSCHFEGINRFKMRELIADILSSTGRLVKVYDYKTDVSICQRSGDLIEPMFLNQWHLDCKESSTKLSNILKEDKLTFIPEKYKTEFMHWLNNRFNESWCLSRQIDWGHKLPIYWIKVTLKSDIVLESKCIMKFNHNNQSIKDNNTEFCAKKSLSEAEEYFEKKFGKCNVKVSQETDVLDTWFSSALIPHIYKDIKSKKRLIFTASDIINAWISRMLMLSIELDDRLSFDTVYIHSIIRDHMGQKMSKSVGNVIDPLQIVEGGQSIKVNKNNSKNIKECGVDALRISLLSHCSTSRFLNINLDEFEAWNRFLNKIWQASRFIIMGFEKNNLNNIDILIRDYTEMDYWILSKKHKMMNDVSFHMDKFEFHSAIILLHDFFKFTFCDIYLEYSKSHPNQLHSLKLMLLIVVNYLNLLLPFCPYISTFIKNYFFKLVNSEKEIKLNNFLKLNQTLSEAEYLNSEKKVDTQIGILQNMAKNRISGSNKIIELYLKGPIFQDMDTNLIKTICRAAKVHINKDVYKDYKRLQTYHNLNQKLNLFCYDYCK